MDRKLDGYRRYALFWAPERDSPLERFGAAWFARDPERPDEPPDAPSIPGLPLGREELTATPCRYGLHATLRSPFQLVDGVEELDRALQTFAARTRAVMIPPLTLNGDLGFVTLRPSQPSPQVDDLAAACVREFHPYATRPNEDEFARRRARPLSDAEERNLELWWYPYVMDAFRFHITLTGMLSAAMAAEVIRALSPFMQPMTDGPVAIRSIALFGERPGGDFLLLKRYPLTG